MTPVRFAAVLTALLVSAGAAWLLWQHFQPATAQPAPAATAAAGPPTGPRYRIPEAAAEPLPALNASDPLMHEALAALLGAESLRRFFRVEDLVRNLVASIDNLPRETLPTRLNPLKPVGGQMFLERREELLAIAPANASRYSAHIALMEAVDTAQLVALYVRFYPLFQQAYQDLGFPQGYFNDRLVTVIDHLLATPEVKGPILLATPHVLHEYADPELEERSAGQKLLIRMGTENAARVKAKLRDVRREVLARSPGS